MENDFGAKLKSVLSDPEAMAKISAIASSLGMPSSSETAAAPAEPPQSNYTEPKPQSGADSLSALAQNFFPQSADPRISLLNSVKPLLREEKRQRIDALTQALLIASVMKNFRK